MSPQEREQLNRIELKLDLILTALQSDGSALPPSMLPTASTERTCPACGQLIRYIQTPAVTPVCGCRFPIQEISNATSPLPPSR